jgi:hypothetical protein
VRLNGQVPQTFSYTPGTKTLDVISPPCADGTVEINGDQVATVASGGLVNIMVEQDGNPVGTFDPNTNSWVIPPCGAGGSVSLAISNTSPNVGDTITLTATADFAATNYLFFVQQNGLLFPIPWVNDTDNVITWTVDVNGPVDVRVLATDGTVRVWGIETVTTVNLIPTNGLVWWSDPLLFQRISGIAYEDFSGNDLLGSFVNAPALSKSGGGTVTYNGVNQRIDQIGGVSTFSFVSNTHQFTFAAFVRWDNLTQRFFFGNNVLTAGKGFFVGLDISFSNQLRFAVQRGVGGANIVYHSPNNAIADTNWHHIAVTCDGIGNAQWYVDGSPVTTSTAIFGTAALGTGNDTRPVEIGAASYSSQFFAGDIGPSLMWNRQLSGAEITDVFNNDRSRYGI